MKEYNIKNVDCAVCAKKIEEHIKKNSEVKDVAINLVANKIIIDNEQIGPKQIEQLANEVEDGVVVSAEQFEETVNKFSIELIQMSVSFILLIAGFLFRVEFLYIIGYLVVGLPVIKLAIKNTIHKQFFDEYFLMTIATFAAIAIGQYSEALAVMLFYSVGEYIQKKTLDKTKLSITKLAKLNEKYATKINGEDKEIILASEVAVGDKLLVSMGSRVAVDSIIVNQGSEFDTSHITGESQPRFFKTGEEVYAGSINVGQEVVVQAIRIKDDSMINKLIELVTYAASKKTKTEQFITKFSKVYTPIVVILAVLIVLILPTVLNLSLNEAVYRAVTLLVISCPCAFVLSVPLGYVVAIGKMASEHILVKGSYAIDRLKDITVVAFDKTGTLTTGNFEIINFQNFSNYSDKYIHSLVYSSEQTITHPIAMSLGNYTAGNGSVDISNLIQIPGFGISFEYQKNLYELIKLEAIDESTSSVLYENGIKIAIYQMADEVKAESQNLIKDLKRYNIQVLMLTGDNKLVANLVAKKIGISLTDVYSNLLPGNKLEVVEEKIEAGEVVAFVGDGLNDAAVIKRSDVGVAMGAAGSELSIDSSDVVISDDQISKLFDAIYISKKTNKIIKQNIIFAFAIKIVFITLGIFGITTMWEAVFSDVGVTLIAIANSMRIRGK